MEKNEANFEAYFTGKMSSDELEKFNHELNSNEEFKKEFDFFLSIKAASVNIERDNLRNELQNIHIDDLSSDSEQPTTKPAKSNRLLWLISAFLLLALSYITYKNIFTVEEPEQLFAQNYEPYIAQQARGNTAEELKQSYISKDYSGFITNAKEVEMTPELYMMLANAYIATNAFELAESSFLQISDNSSLRDQKYWLLGLVQLKLNKLEKAKSTFLKLQSLSNYKNKEIEKILSQLK